MALCDGTVRHISYTIDLTVHTRLGNRKDGEADRQRRILAVDHINTVEEYVRRFIQLIALIGTLSLCCPTGAILAADGRSNRSRHDVGLGPL